MATDREPIERQDCGKVGIDPGFKNLLTIAALDGQWEKVEHPRELEAIEHRWAQAQRGHNKVLAAGLHEHRANQVKDRNHQLSLRLVQENEVIRFSKDHHRGVAKKFGKSVSSSSH
jgi:transposase